MIAQIDSKYFSLSIKKTFTRLLSYVFYEGRPLTTKGRFINSLIFLLFKIQSNLPYYPKIVSPVFIVGTGRSGSTILGITLGMHSEVGFLNEPKAFWSYLYNKEDLIGSYQKVPGDYRLTSTDVTLTMVNKAHRILGCYLLLGCSSRVVDKYPELIFRADFVSKIFPDAKFLFLYRNGRDTCHSIQNWSKRLTVKEQGETHDWWGRNDQKWRLLCDQVISKDREIGTRVELIRKYSNHEHRAAVEWIVSMKEGMGLLERKPECVMGVKYEDYVSKLDTRQKVLGFCELAHDGNYDKYCETVLKKENHKTDMNLPPEIQEEFNRVMNLLGYE